MSLRAEILAAFEDVVVGARLLWRLPSFLRQPVSVEDARAVLRGRLERREADFLALVKHAVFDDRGSPYRQLLSWAGCEYGDVERLVEQRGVEGALGVLFQAGVYLTADELKGRRPTVRGNATLTVDPDRLRNRALTSHLLGRSTGSGGPRTPVRIDLESVWDQVIDLRLFIEARAETGSVHAVWGVPGSWPDSGTKTGSQQYFDWFRYEFWRFVFVQQEVVKLAMTAVEFPPMQKGASFNLDAVKAKIEAARAAMGK